MQANVRFHRLICRSSMALTMIMWSIKLLELLRHLDSSKLSTIEFPYNYSTPLSKLHITSLAFPLRERLFIAKR
ncbi:hypothetical protein Gotur_024051 [Gossypium turneri]